MAFWPPFDRNLYRGLTESHKLASSGFHLEAAKCIATRCHPCLKNQSVALILEDDYAFAGGRSPTAIAADFPRLLLDAYARLKDPAETTKIHLGVNRKSTCSEPPETVDGWPDARVRRCHNFADAHAYTLSYKQALLIVDAQSSLLKGYVECVDPWNDITCGRDPSLMSTFMKQCKAKDEMKRCRGFALGSSKYKASLFKLPSADKYRSEVNLPIAMYARAKIEQRKIEKRKEKRSGTFWKQKLPDQHGF